MRILIGNSLAVITLVVYLIATLKVIGIMKHKHMWLWCWLLLALVIANPIVAIFLN